MAGGDRHQADTALVVALAGGATVREAAEQAGVSERTAYRRREDPAFSREVDQARAEMRGRTLGALSVAAVEAAATLRALLHAESESVRLGACKAILEIGPRLREADELERRVADLEEAVAEATAARERRG